MAIELWAVRVDRPLTEAESAALTPLLPPRRAERLAQTSPEVRREPLCAYALLTLSLRELLGWKALPEIALAERGKPGFPAYPEIHFNLSHTKGAVLAGLAGAPLGVDVERIRPIRRRTIELLLEAPATEEEFFRSWVRREARAKRGGVEVGGALRREPPPSLEESYYPLDLFPGYAAGAACSAGEPLGAVRRYTLEELLEGVL